KTCPKSTSRASAPTRQYERPSSFATVSTARMTDRAMGLTGRSGLTQSMRDLSVVKQSCGVKVARIVRGNQIRVDEDRWDNIGMLWICRHIPETVEQLDIPLGICAQSVLGDELC